MSTNNFLAKDNDQH